MARHMYAARDFALWRAKSFVSVGIFAIAAEIPTRSGFFVFFRENEWDEEQRLALYSLFTELRRTASARRFWFLRGNVHLFCCPQGPLLFGHSLDTIPP
jgi:hypothetical protein